MGAITLKNVNSPESSIRFLIRGYGVSHIVKNIHLYDPVSKKVIMIISKFSCDKDVDEIQFGLDSNSIAFMKDIPNFELKRRRKENFDGAFFIIPLGYKEQYNSYYRRSSSMSSRRTTNTCSLYIPSNAFTKTKLLSKGKTVENFKKILFQRFLLEVSDVKSGTEYVLTGKCNCKEVPLNKNKDMIDELKKITKISNNFKQVKMTQEWKDKLILNLENFINKYEDYDVQR